MNIDEILKRPSPANYTIEELEYAVSEYIFKKKGQRVEVNIRKDLPKDMVLNQFQIMKLHKQHTDLMSAFGDVQQNYYL